MYFLFFESPPTEHVGGSGIKLKSILDSGMLSPENTRIYGIYGEKNYYNNFKYTSFNFFESKYIRKYYIYRLLYEIINGFFIFLNIIFLFKERYRGAIVSVPAFFPAILICSALKIKRIPYIVDLRDEYPYLLYEKLKINYKIRYFLSFFLEAYLRNASFILAPTKIIYNRLIHDYKFNFKKILLVYNGFPNYFINIKKNKSQKPLIVCHGGFGYFSNIDMYFSEIKFLKSLGFRVIVVGHGVEFNNLIKKLKGVWFVSSKPMQRVAKLLAKAHLGISFRDNTEYSKSAFPLKIWDYVGLNVYSLVYPPGECSEFLESNNLGAEYSRDFFKKPIEISCSESFSSHDFTRENASILILNHLFKLVRS